MVEKTMHVHTSFRKYGNRKVEIKVGMKYVIQPLNPRKQKNRNRICLVLDFIPISESHPKDMVAKVRYLDTNRIGKAELDDLVPVA